MRYRRFGRTELQVSAVSLGGAYLGGKGDPERAEENAQVIVRRALDLGCNTSTRHHSTGRAKSCWARRWPGSAAPFTWRPR